MKIKAELRWKNGQVAWQSKQWVEVVFHYSQTVAVHRHLHTTGNLLFLKPLYGHATSKSAELIDFFLLQGRKVNIFSHIAFEVDGWSPLFWGLDNLIGRWKIETVLDFEVNFQIELWSPFIRHVLDETDRETDIIKSLTFGEPGKWLLHIRFITNQCFSHDHIKNYTISQNQWLSSCSSTDWSLENDSLVLEHIFMQFAIDGPLFFFCRSWSLTSELSPLILSNVVLLKSKFLICINKRRMTGIAKRDIAMFIQNRTAFANF